MIVARAIDGVWNRDQCRLVENSVTAFRRVQTRLGIANIAFDKSDPFPSIGKIILMPRGEVVENNDFMAICHQTVP